MADLEKLKLLVFESKYPYFSDEDLQNYLELYGDNIYYAASQLCLMKMDIEKSIKVGPITVENPEPSYWKILAAKYLDIFEHGGVQNRGDVGYYPIYMKRADEL
ncbi:hypothetical protein [Clostridium kluyveri]|uniref:hypothetical protein n=1 Tax=Clostridium kluyveri TaxID=1534 RepID=UPI002247348E|nr:hypothetical protein [Clostridium kluyveri]UZQ49108.1 hypothetical protein OP486_14215 [Clostridium kluyveri]